MCSFLDPIFAEYVSDKYVDDLIDYKQVKLVFLVESPHTEEVDNKIPLFGISGTNLTNALKSLEIKCFEDITYGFGEWLSEQHELNRYKQIGIMNVSNIRLDNQISNDKDLNKYIDVLKFIKDSCTRTQAKYVNGNLNIVNIITQLSKLTKSTNTNPKDIPKIYKLISDINNNNVLYQQLLDELKTNFYYRLARIKNSDCYFVVLGNVAENFYKQYYDINKRKYIKTLHPSDKNSESSDKKVHMQISDELTNHKECINKLFEG